MKFTQTCLSTFLLIFVFLGCNHPKPTDCSVIAKEIDKQPDKVKIGVAVDKEYYIQDIKECQEKSSRNAQGRDFEIFITRDESKEGIEREEDKDNHIYFKELKLTSTCDFLLYYNELHLYDHEHVHENKNKHFVEGTLRHEVGGNVDDPRG